MEFCSQEVKIIGVTQESESILIRSIPIYYPVFWQKVLAKDMIPTKIFQGLLSRKWLDFLDHASVTFLFQTSISVSQVLNEKGIIDVAVQPIVTKDLKIVVPGIFSSEKSRLMSSTYNVWNASIRYSVDSYQRLLRKGVRHDIAAGVLPGDVMVEGISTRSFRFWYELLLKETNQVSDDVQTIFSAVTVQLMATSPLVFGSLAEKWLAENEGGK